MSESFASPPTLDDESLGCGGTLAKHTQRGDAVSVFAMADGVLSRTGGVIDMNAIKERHGCLRRACKVLGTEDVWIAAYPDNQMDKGPLLQIVKEVELHVERFKPTIVYTHWHGDLNIDHRIVSQAVQTACRPLPTSTVKTLLMFEVVGSTELGSGFVPNWFEGIEDEIDMKLTALECYGDEIRPYPHPRSFDAVRNLALTRGASVGLPYAEAFVLHRGIA